MESKLFNFIGLNLYQNNNCIDINQTEYIAALEMIGIASWYLKYVN